MGNLKKFRADLWEKPGKIFWVGVKGRAKDKSRLKTILEGKKGQ
jgi:hypothetical protein